MFDMQLYNSFLAVDDQAVILSMQVFFVCFVFLIPLGVRSVY